jgi:GntR family transcriptional regulator
MLTMDDEVMSSWPDLTYGSDLPAHTRIAYWLERLIISRQVEPGDKLPSEVEFAGALGISRMTLRQALAGLELKGLLERRRGRFGGNFVSEPRFDYGLAGLPGFTEQMRRAHVQAGSQIVRAVTRRPAEHVRLALGLRRGEQVHEVIRVRSANGEPVMLEETYFPASVFPGFLTGDLMGSLYDRMRRDYGQVPFAAEEVIEPMKATAERAELLNIDVDDPLLLITRTSLTQEGLPVEYSCDYFRPDRSRVTVRTTVEGQPSRDIDVRISKQPPA